MERMNVLVCGGTGCLSSEGEAIYQGLKKQMTDRELDEITVVKTGCFGFCEKGPIVKVLPDNTFYTEVKASDVDDIVEEHIVKGRKVKRLLYTDPMTNETVEYHKDMDFYKKQMRIATRNCGKIDPMNILEYIAADGYFALANVLKSGDPDAVVKIIKDAGLRGRGGAGFPTGLKWEMTKKAESDKKYVVCNADEGDPGAFMDRSILEGDPHSVLEAMIICGFVIGADEGKIYTRAEYPLAIERLEKAIEQAREYGLIGKDILGSGFEFDISISIGAGAFVCGEETALLNSMEGNRGEPWVKPPFPSTKGYNGKPTNVNNVETYANIPVILNKGSEWYSSIGTDTSNGTKVFALAGNINNVGLIEVPMGTTLREIIYDIGGGIKDGKKFKAIQTGGPSGGFLTEADLDTPIDYESLRDKDCMMGSGAMIVMDENDCMPAIAKFYLGFTQDESCGKCTPCRIGTKRMLEVMEMICEGKGKMEHLHELERLSRVIQDTALCGLGQSAPNPVISSIRHFRDEYVAHIEERRCPAHQCKKLIQYGIDKQKCIGCSVCARKCPVDAITGVRKEPYTIDNDKCIKCGVCESACKFDAIMVS